MSVKILHRFTGAVLFECELPAEIAAQSKARQLGYAVKQALTARADLAGADLAGANLAGADLADADLADADLARANLAGAYLAGAYLAGADLAGADLAGAYLAGAYLAGADLAGADLAGADLVRANLAGADLARADNVPETNGSESIERPQVAMGVRTRLSRKERMLRFRERNPDVPVVEDLDAKILAAITETGGGSLDMGAWHTCETTHCRAGWAITLAGKAGANLEAERGPERAGAAIYRASTGRRPWFFASNAMAMEDIRRCAEEAQS